MKQDEIITHEDISCVLKIIKERGYVSWSLCNNALSSSNKATSMLRILANRGFIQANNTGEWTVNIARIDEYQSAPEEKQNTLKSTTVEDFPAVDEDSSFTIKDRGFRNIITQKEFSSLDFNVNVILTSDLTASEIEESLIIIQEMKTPLSRFMVQYTELSDKLEKNEAEYKRIEEESKNLTMGVGFFPGLIWWICLGVTVILGEKKILDVPTIVVLMIVVSFGCVSYYLWARENAEQEANSLIHEAQDSIEPAIRSLKQQITSLPATAFLKNTNYGVSLLSAYLINKRLIQLEPILRKMLIIASDKETTASGRLLAMENYLHLLKKQEMDEKLLNESRRANELAEERIKAIQDMENAVNLQTEYQIWQDRGYELGKLSAASRLYQKNK